MLNLKSTEQAKSAKLPQQQQELLAKAFGKVLSNQIIENRPNATPAPKDTNTTPQPQQNITNEENSSDIDWDDDDAELDRIQISRKQQMAQTGLEINYWKKKGHGSYEVIQQSEFLPIASKTELVIVHFFHRDFERCKLFDKHLALIAPKYLPVRFIALDAEKTPFFVEKLAVRVLPSLFLLKDGKIVDKLIGFAELGNKDNFTTKELEDRLKQNGFLQSIKGLHDDDEDRLADDEKINMKSKGLSIHAALASNKDDIEVDDTDA